VTDQEQEVQQQESTAEEQMTISSSALPAGAVPQSILIAPWGEVKSANGRFVLDDESARLVLEAFEKHGTDLPIDYEHQSLGGVYSSPNGQAPAAGWIRSLRVVSPSEDEHRQAGLFAEVEWTESAQTRLTAKEYRYLSPVVIVRKSDRRVIALHSAALTNKPAIVGMKPIVNRETVQDLHEKVQDSTDAVDNKDEEVLAVLRVRLGLDADCGVEMVLQKANDQLVALMQKLAEREAADRVAAAMSEGKLTPAQRDWAMSLALKDPVAFDAWVASAPAVVMIGQTQAPAGVEGCSSRDRSAVTVSARATFRSHPELALLTSEQAWIEDALREAGVN